MSWLPRKKIVVPVDFSDLSFAAVDTALEIAETPADVYIIHVLPELSPSEPGVVWNTIDDEGRKKHAYDALEQRLSDARYSGVNIEVVIGDAGNEITNYTAKIAGDLVVLPSHGRTGLSRLLIGSVAERVTRLAHCPVLVLRK